MYRFVSAGSIEEIMYHRQIYKQQQQVYHNAKPVQRHLLLQQQNVALNGQNVAHERRYYPKPSP